MTLFHLAFIALIQGITEFLPVSSSAHLILFPILFHLEDQGPLIDIMAHLGSLGAVMLYFKRDVKALFLGVWDLIKRQKSRNARLLLNLLIATPPTLIIGFSLHAFGIDLLLRSPLVIAMTTLIFGFFLWHSDKSAMIHTSLEEITPKSALFLGFAQVMALIPGVSRSGITMTMGRYLRLDRETSAHFSMLLSLPLIGAFGMNAFFQLLNQPDSVGPFNWKAGLIVALLSFLSAYLVITLFMKLIPRVGFGIFALYRLCLGTFLLFLFL